MLRRAENVYVSHKPNFLTGNGPVHLHVGNRIHLTSKKMHKDEFQSRPRPKDPSRQVVSQLPQIKGRYLRYHLSAGSDATAPRPPGTVGLFLDMVYPCFVWDGRTLGARGQGTSCGVS
jgi:hypothetical protein